MVKISVKQFIRLARKQIANAQQRPVLKSAHIRQYSGFHMLVPGNFQTTSTGRALLTLSRYTSKIKDIYKFFYRNSEDSGEGVHSLARKQIANAQQRPVINSAHMRQSPPDSGRHKTVTARCWPCWLEP